MDKNEEQFWSDRDWELGTKSDKFLAELWDIQVSQVKARREKLGIPDKDQKPSGKAPNRISASELNDLWRDIDPILGSQSDAKIAKEWSVPARNIRSRREELGIPSWRSSQPSKYNDIEWTAENEALLGVISDNEIAKRLNAAPHKVRKHREKLGIPTKSERERRTKKEEETKRQNQEYRAIDWPDELLREIGKRFIPNLAKQYGIPEWAILRKGKEMNIHMETRPLSHLYENEP